MHDICVLHLNIRITEGGAARVARELHFALPQHSIKSYYGYGYSRRGRRSPIDTGDPSLFRVSNQLQSAANRVIHRIFGVDAMEPFGAGRRELEDKLQRCSVVHLHAIHSHYVPYKWLLNRLHALGKPVVWTAHDHWMITGRCAFTDLCTNWKIGCGKCTTNENYPPSLFDQSSGEYREKHAAIRALGNALTVVSPSKHLAKDILESFPEVKLETIANSVDQEFDEILTEQENLASQANVSCDTPRILLIANDLSYQGKTDRAIVARLISETDADITTVGRNSPFSGARVTNHGEVSDRRKLVEIYQNSSAILFSSVVDNFPLVLCEAQSAGLPVLATFSPAAEEVLDSLGGKCLSSEEILRAVQQNNFWAGYSNISCRHILAQTARKTFGLDSMVQAYISLYRRVVARQGSGAPAALTARH